MGKTRLDWKIENNLMERAGQTAEMMLRFARERTAPIDPLKIAAAEADQLSVVGDNFKNAFDGQLEYHHSKKRFLLFYNNKYDRSMPAGEHHPRTRFSIAHELGHFYLDRHNEFLRRGGRKHGSKGEFGNDYVTEREADSFAAHLLMPKFLIDELVNESELSLNRIDELADRFKTSLLSTTYRAISVAHFPCAAVGLRDGQTAWVCRSDSLVDLGFYPPPRGAFTSETARRQWTVFSKGGSDRHLAPAYAKNWFRTFDRSHLDKVSITEHYLPIPILDTLVVLLTVPEDELDRLADEE